MAGYYNPYATVGFPSQYPQMSYATPTQMPVQQPQPQPMPMQNNGMIWVDGEIGAKAYQLNGQTGPVALWDTNDQIIYLKSVNQMGMPNPLQKIRYQMEETPAGMITSGNNGMSGTDGMSGHDQKMQSEIDSLRNDIRELKDAVMQMKTPANPQRNQNNQRGGNQNA